VLRANASRRAGLSFSIVGLEAYPTVAIGVRKSARSVENAYRRTYVPVFVGHLFVGHLQNY
jgi:hypothetical protein